MRRRASTPHTRTMRRALACALAAALCCASAHASASTPRASGAPGARPWIVERAELHGLSTNALEEASSNVETIVSRDCFLVAKDGAIVHESYYGANDANTQTTTDGVGALALVAAVGVAVQQGLFELDAPLSKYDLRSVEEAFGAYADKVSVRQLLAQTHGGGSREPGTTFERDDPRNDGFLDIVGDIIELRSGMKLSEWARVNVGEKLGAPEMFASSSRADGNDGASLWRDLRMSCRDAAKLGQLFVNQGRWTSVDGSTRQMFDPTFAVSALSVSYPSLNQAHGLMTWLHVPVSATGTQCCAPRTTKTSCGMSAEAISGPILGRNAPHAPVAVSLGDEGSMIFMLPETKTVVVTLGRTAPGSPACPVAPSDVVAKVGSGRRDDAYLMRTIWSAMGGALKPVELDSPTKKSKRTAALEHDWHRWEEKKASKHSKKHSTDSDDRVASEGSSEGASSSILDAVREAITEVMGGEAKKDGLIHDDHATYEAPGDAGEMKPTTFRLPMPSPGDLAAEEYEKRQIEYARQMQEREYKKFEAGVQKDYRKALKQTREKYQKAMRAAQSITNVAQRAQAEDVAAAEYLEAVNKIEETGKQALQQLDSWRKATLPPLKGDEDVGFGASKNKESDLGSVAAHRAKPNAIDDLSSVMSGVSEKMRSIGLRASEKIDFEDNRRGDTKEDADDGTFSLPKLGDTHVVPHSMRGSCVCGCPNTKTSQATCFDVDASALGSSEQAADACSAMHSRAGLGCPHTGIVQQCGEVIGKRGFASDDLECRQVRKCPRSKEDAAKTAFLAAVFDCTPTRFASCSFVAEPCAHSHVVIKPVLQTEDDASALARPQHLRRAAHRFHEHQHAHLHGNAMQRWFQQSSAELSVALAVVILALALMTVASKWPTAVTGGDMFFGQLPPRQVRRMSPGVAERAPLLASKTRQPHVRSVSVSSEIPPSSPSSPSSDEDESPVRRDVVQRFPRPIKVTQPQTGEAYEEIVKPTRRVPVSEVSADDDDDSAV